MDPEDDVIDLPETTVVGGVDYLTTRERLTQGVGNGFRLPTPRATLADLAPQPWIDLTPGSGGGALGDAIKDLPMWQLFNDINIGQSAFEVDPDYDPLAPDEIKGWERYATTLSHARSKSHADAVKAQLTENEARRQRMSINGGIVTDLMAEIFNPINYIATPFAVGGGVLKSAARVAGYNAPIIAGEELFLRQEVDPTATRDEVIGNTFYGVIFSGLLGGALGGLQRYVRPSRVNRMAELYETENIVRDAVAEGRDPLTAFRNARAQRAAQPQRRAAPVMDEAALPFDVEDFPEAMRNDPDVITYLELSESTRAKEKISDPETWTPEEKALYDAGDWEGFSRARGYTEAEISEFSKMLAAADKVIKKYGVDDVQALDATVAEKRQMRDEGLPEPEPVPRAEDGAEPPGPKDTSTVYDPKPTGDIDPGLQKAFGVEKLALRTPFIRLVQSGYQAVADLALTMAGDFSEGLARNIANIATPDSAFLRAGAWRAQAFDVTRKIDELYNEYLTDGGSKGRDVAGLNLATTASRVRGTFQKVRPDGKLTPQAFEEAIFRAFKAEKIDSDDPYILRGAQTVDGFFTAARNAGYETGLLPSRQFARKRYERIRNLLDEATIELETPANANVEALLLRRVARLKDEFDDIEARVIGRDEKLAKIADDIRNKAQEKIKAANSKREAVLHSLDESIERDLGLFTHLNEQHRTRGLSEKQQKLHRLLKDRLERLFERRIKGEAATPPKVTEDNNLTSSRDGAPLAAVYRNGEIIINPKLIAEGFQRRAWRTPRRPGVMPLSDDHFPTVDAWRDFIVAHERAHETRKKRANETVDEYENRINYEGLSDTGKLTLEDYLAYATDKQKAYIDLLDTIREEPLSVRQREYLDAIDRRFREDIYHEDMGAPREKHYLPRVWDRPAILADETGPKKLRKILASHYRDTAAQMGLKTDAASIEKRVDDTINKILGLEHEFEELSGFSGRFFFQKHRNIDIPNEKVADFVERSVGTLTRQYADSFGISVEMARMYGTRKGDDAIESALLQAAREGASAEKLAKMEGEMIDLRDMTLSDMYRNDPLTWTGLGVDGMKAWAATTMLGRVIKSMAVEPARIFMANGLLRTFGAEFDILSRNLDKFNEVGDELRALTGESVDTVLSSAARRFVTEGHYMAPSKSTLLNKAYAKSRPFLDFASGPYYILNLMALATDIMKKHQNVLGSHFIIEDAIKHTKGKASARTLKRYAALGLSPEDLSRIASLSERSGRLNLPATAKWDDPGLVQRFASAVAGETRRVIASSGPSAKAPLLTGHFGKPGEREKWALAAMPFQFMQFPIAAVNKYMISFAQGRDASPLLGAVMLIGFGYLSAWLKSSSYSWSQMPLEEKMLRAIELSSIMGLYSDIPAMLEQATGNRVGLRPVLGLEARYPWADELDQASVLWGPGGDKIVDMYRMFRGDTDNRDRARILRRSVPLADLVYWHNQFRKIDPYIENAMDGLDF